MSALLLHTFCDWFLANSPTDLLPHRASRDLVEQTSRPPVDRAPESPHPYVCSSTDHSPLDLEYTECDDGTAR